MATKAKSATPTLEELAEAVMTTRIQALEDHGRPFRRNGKRPAKLADLGKTEQSLSRSIAQQLLATFNMERKHGHESTTEAEQA